VLKLLFADGAGPDQVAKLAKAQLDAHNESLERYRETAGAVEFSGDGPYRAAALRWGIAFSECMLDFWGRVAESAERSGSVRW
jgi:hypothetical protein